MTGPSNLGFRSLRGLTAIVEGGDHVENVWSDSPPPPSRAAAQRGHSKSTSGNRDNDEQRVLKA
jgi:hypothetical protein